MKLCRLPIPTHHPSLGIYMHIVLACGSVVMQSCGQFQCKFHILPQVYIYLYKYTTHVKLSNTTAEIWHPYISLENTGMA